MKRLLWDDGEEVHRCQSSQVHPDVLLVWTQCEKDVPPGAAVLSEAEITCAKCKRLRHERKDPDGINPWGFTRCTCGEDVDQMEFNEHCRKNNEAVTP